jgi:hypothetical protein
LYISVFTQIIESVINESSVVYRRYDQESNNIYYYVSILKGVRVIILRRRSITSSSPFRPRKLDNNYGYINMCSHQHELHISVTYHII